MIPRYVPRAARALAMLKSGYNDVDIFVEDTGNHNMWLFVLRRLLPPGTRLDSVNMLGGRDVVTEACALDQIEDGRRKLYIIDGDFDYLLRRSKPRLKYLYRLRAYCVENLLMSKEALVQIGMEYKPKLTEAQIANDIDYDALSEELEQHFRPLFQVYALAHILVRRLETVGHPMNSLLEARSTGAIIDGSKVRTRMVNLCRRLIKDVGPSAVRKTYDSIVCTSAKLPIEQIVSGKDYVLPYALIRLKARCGYGASSEPFKVALARNYDPSREPYLRRRIRALAS